MLRTFIQTLALGLTVGASYFLIRSVLNTSVKDIADLATTNWNFSYQVAENLSRQRSDTVVGFTLLLLSLAISLVNLLWPMRWSDFGVDRIGAVAGVAASLLLCFAGAKISDSLHNRYYKQAVKILEEKGEAVERAVKNKDHDVPEKLTAPPPHP